MTSLVRRMYRHPYAPLAAFVFIVVMGAVGLAAVSRQADALEAEQRVRAEAVCDTSAQGRATQLIFGEIIIAASADGEPDPGRQERVARFRRLLDERMVGTLPPACDGVMGLAEYRRRVRASVDEATTGLTQGGAN